MSIVDEALGFWQKMDRLGAVKVVAEYPGRAGRPVEKRYAFNTDHQHYQDFIDLNDVQQ